ncbi:uncharacterized protein [Coffea arabica]|uniref:Uncharacterized protein n=1 Tax=Coffea arabica TaxID=13443 RepID=A0ABM4VB37_COFAR
MVRLMWHVPGHDRDFEPWLVDTRVTGDSCFSIWMLKDYQSRFWIHNYWIVEQLPGSLFDGRILAFGQKADFVLLRVKKNIFSYNFRTRELKKSHQILKNYAHEDKCDGLLVPYYLPRDHPPVIPLAVRANSPSLSGEGTRESAWPLAGTLRHQMHQWTVYSITMLFPIWQRSIRSGLAWLPGFHCASNYMWESTIALIVINGQCHATVI